jgi:hypothetical protein
MNEKQLYAVTTTLALMSGGVFINYAVWESTEQYKRAFNNP